MNSRNPMQWFSLSGRRSGGLAFILNRLSALGLSVYLYLHLFVLGKLARGPQAFDSFIATAHSPLYILGELLVIAAVLYHGLNGVRIVLTGFGLGVPHQKKMFYLALGLSALATLLFAIRMFTVS